MVRRLEAAAARHVGDAHFARAGVLLQIRTDQPRVAGMAAGGAARDDDVEHLVLVVVRRLAVRRP